ncbi:hypothetical protein EGW08_017862 [Elysia chlorotica]|uniref:SMB domain-containing protein n=1 Tax=Elysia chlorotica TaxID=188477 RepID=A0A3S1B2C0_ELYCH|nr:hypothetical protein EGW08_017862 [Elysia chlorotica]
MNIKGVVLFPSINFYTSIKKRRFLCAIQASSNNAFLTGNVENTSSSQADLSPEKSIINIGNLSSFLEILPEKPKKGDKVWCNSSTSLNGCSDQLAQSLFGSAVGSENGTVGMGGLANETGYINRKFRPHVDSQEVEERDTPRQPTPQPEQIMDKSVLIGLQVGTLLRLQAYKDTQASQIPTVTSSTPSTETPLLETPMATCRGKCGLKSSFPCGCSASCIVYGNCCQDLETDCPNVAAQALEIFSRFLDVDIMCDDDEVYKVISCPKKTENDAKEDDHEPEIEHKFDFLKVQDHERWINKMIGDMPHTSNTLNSDLEEHYQDNVTLKINTALLLSAPVTDLYTGITFINRSIWECNNMPEDSIYTWSLRLKYTFKTPVNLEDLEPLLQTQNRYMPTFDERLLYPHLCLTDVITKCISSEISMSTDSNKELKDKCENGSNSVVSATNRNLYNNIFCAYCNEGRNATFYQYKSHQPGYKDFDLKVLMSRDRNGEYSLTLINNAATLVPWLSSQCVISETGPTQRQGSSVSSRDNFVCAATCSNSYFNLKADGICKATYMTLVALADDGLPPLCRKAKPFFVNFIVCGLKRMLPLLKHADFHQPSLMVQFDTRLQKNIYVMRLLTDLPAIANGFFAEEVAESWNNFHRIAVIARAFALYRASQELCNAENEEEEEMIEQHETNIETISLTNGVHMFKDTSLFNTSGLYIRGQVVDPDKKTTTCLTFTFLPKSDVSAQSMLCSEESARERDEDMIRALGECQSFQPLFESAGLSRNGHVTRPGIGLAWSVCLVAAVVVFGLLHNNM